jgi:hypothetical protein
MSRSIRPWPLPTASRNWPSRSYGDSFLQDRVSDGRYISDVIPVKAGIQKRIEGFWTPAADQVEGRLFAGVTCFEQSAYRMVAGLEKPGSLRRLLAVCCSYPVFPWQIRDISRLQGHAAKSARPQGAPFPHGQRCTVCWLWKSEVLPKIGRRNLYGAVGVPLPRGTWPSRNTRRHFSLPGDGRQATIFSWFQEGSQQL